MVYFYAEKNVPLAQADAFLYRAGQALWQKCARKCARKGRPLCHAFAQNSWEKAAALSRLFLQVLYL